jgi:hypothetical protein
VTQVAASEQSADKRPQWTNSSFEWRSERFLFGLEAVALDQLGRESRGLLSCRVIPVIVAPTPISLSFTGIKDDAAD